MNRFSCIELLANGQTWNSMSTIYRPHISYPGNDKSVDEKIIMKFTRRTQTGTSCKKVARKKAGG